MSWLFIHLYSKLGVLAMKATLEVQKAVSMYYVGTHFAQSWYTDCTKFACWLHKVWTNFAIHQQLVSIKIKFKLSSSQEPSQCLFWDTLYLAHVLTKRFSPLHTPPVKQPAFTNTWRQPLWNLKLFNTFFVWYLFVILNLSECVGILSSVTLIGLMDRQGAVNSSAKMDMLLGGI